MLFFKQYFTSENSANLTTIEEGRCGIFRRHLEHPDPKFPLILMEIGTLTLQACLNTLSLQHTLQTYCGLFFLNQNNFVISHFTDVTQKAKNIFVQTAKIKLLREVYLV